MPPVMAPSKEPPIQLPPFAPWRCQECGAYIGYFGRFFQRFIGCWLVQSRECKR